MAEIIVIDIGDAHLDEENLREDWTSKEAQAELEALAVNIAANGIRDIPKARPHPTIPGGWDIWDGNRRTTAIRMLHERGIHIPTFQLGQMPVMVGMATTDAEKLVGGLIANSARRDLNDWEECKGYCKILLSGVPFDGGYVALTPAELEQVVAAADLDSDGLKVALGDRVASRALPKAPTVYEVVERLAKAVASKTMKYVVKRIGFRRLIPEAQEQIRKGQLGVAFAECLIPLSTERQHQALKRLSVYDMSKTEFAQLCLQLAAVQNEDEQLDLFALWDSEMLARQDVEVKKRKMVTGLRKVPGMTDILPPRNLGNTNEALAYMIAEAKKQGAPESVIVAWEHMQDAMLRSYWKA